MKKVYMFVLAVGAVLSLIIAAIYFSKTAGALPHFFPGYRLGSGHTHTKHGIFFVTLALVFALGAWMMSGSKPSASGPENNAN